MPATQAPDVTKVAHFFINLIRTMRSTPVLSDASVKNQARLLKTFLEGKGLKLSHTTCLEALAALHGHKSWHHFRATLESVPRKEVTPSLMKKVLAALEGGLLAHVPAIQAYGQGLSPMKQGPEALVNYTCASKVWAVETASTLRVAVIPDEYTTLNLYLDATSTVDEDELVVVVTPRWNFCRSRPGAPTASPGALECSYDSEPISGPSFHFDMSASDLPQRIQAALSAMQAVALLDNAFSFEDDEITDKIGSYLAPSDFGGRTSHLT